MLKLTRLKIAGFKSFYAKTEISFPGGITAVVGPNGCGKSNISDAISWVLGEQSSKSLRGNKMEDVIFNGSARRGPLPMAEVSLTLTWDSTHGNGNGNGHHLPEVEVEPETFHPRPGVLEAARVAAGAEDAEAVADPGAEDDATEPGAEPVADAAETLLAAQPSTAAGAAAVEPAAPDALPPAGEPAADDEAQAAPPVFVLPSEDGAAITVTRRLYRNGESEYRIDDKRVRLRDVQDLMQQARIGSRTYAVIEQDRITALLSARAKERKEMIEEAAGILGIKARKRAAILKLEHTETNLSRLRDLVAEISRQVNSLKRQAAKARRYRRNAEEIRRQRRLLFALDHDRLQERLSALSAELERLRDEEGRAAAESSRRGAAVEGLRQRIDEEGQDAGARRDELHAAEREAERLDGDRRALAERIREAEELASRCAREAEERRLRAAEAGESAEQRERERVVLSGTVAELQQALTALEEDYTARLGRADEAARGAEADRGRLLGAVSRLGEARNRAHKLEERGHRLEKQRERLERELEACRQELEEDEARLRRAASELEAGSLELAETEAACAAADRDRDHCAEVAAAAREARADADRQADGLEERARALAAVWRATRDESGASEHGQALGEGVEVDGRWETAAGAWAENILEARVVPDVAAALAAVAHARESGEGRVRLVVPALLPAASGEGRLSGVLKGHRERAALLAASLGDPVLASSLEEAVERWRLQPGRPYLTPEGDGITAQGVIVGGQKGEASRLLACNRQRREAEEEASALRQSLPELDEALAAAGAALTAAGERAETARARREQVRHDLVERRTLHGRLQEETARQQRRRQVLRDEETVLAAEEEEQRREQALVTAEVQAADGDRLRAEASARASQEALDALRAGIQILAGERAERKSELAGRREALAAQEQEINRLRAEAEEHQQRAGAEEEESRRRTELAGRLKEESLVLVASREEVTRRVVALQERVRADELSLQESRAALAAAEQEAKRAAQVLEEARERSRERELARTRVDADREHMERECREEFDCEPAELAADLADEDRQADPEAIRSEIGRLEEIRERLGAVNMMALEQFAEAEERQVYLLSQQKDLEDSIRSLQATIQKIDRTARERFVHALEAIRTEFSRLFQELFGGGVADIELQEPDNVLESGIDIIAQPPGKRTRNISLLSGGEKSLSAIALLFAIFKYRPSPFCLLDEADAALDEANVERFARLIREQRQDTQFILITHNRRSMEVADVMYGVTMEEPGISQTVSLDLG